MAKSFLRAALLSVAAIFLLGSRGAYADYIGGSLIDDSIFVNSSTMSQTDIQNFLSSQGGALASQSFATPSNGNQPAAWIIYYASQHIGINPRVIMATMQKEQSLITDSSPTASQYNYAMGYGCPDTSSCSDPGFWNQTIDGSWQLRFDYERAGGNTGYWTSPDGTQWGNPSISYPCSGASTFYSTGLYAGNTVTFYDGGGSAYATITLSNRSTAALYCYTPHVYPGDSNYYYSGSYNFVVAYENWWGEANASAYNWHLVSQTSSADLNQLIEGQTSTLTVTATNTGEVTWTNTGSTPIRLGTSNPHDRNSAFATAGWISAARPATMNESSVAPGSNATFTFSIKAPSTPGVYKEYFNLLAEGMTWMNDPGMYFYINVVPPTYTYSVSSQAAYTDSTKSTAVDLTKLSPGQTAWLVLGVTNTGNMTWSNTGSNPTDLGTDSTRDRSSRYATAAWLGPNRPARLVQSSVAPGQQGTFEFPIQVPPGGGTYNEYFTPVVEGITWMNATGLNYHTVVNGQYSWALQSQYAYTDSSKSTPVDITNLSPGQTVFIGVTIKNTGTATWYNTGSFPLDFGTSHPQDRNSAFCTTGWLGCNRPVRLKEASVAPGQTGTLEFSYKAPASTGTYYEYFDPVVESIGWLQDIGLNFYSVVK